MWITLQHYLHCNGLNANHISLAIGVRLAFFPLLNKIVVLSDLFYGAESFLGT
jgi:hypothetical protein